MITVNVQFKNSRNNYSTGFNGTEAEARAYFVGTWFNFGDTEAHPSDDMQVCIGIELA